MLILLESLTGPPHPPISAATVRTAAAAVGELWLLERSSSRCGPRISRGSGQEPNGGLNKAGISGSGGGGGGVGGVGGVGSVGVDGGCGGGGGGGGGGGSGVRGSSGDLLWAPGTRYHRIGNMLTEAYALSAGEWVGVEGGEQGRRVLSGRY